MLKKKALVKTQTKILKKIQESIKTKNIWKITFSQ